MLKKYVFLRTENTKNSDYEFARKYNDSNKFFAENRF